MHIYEVLLRPLITEKTQWQVGYEKPQYAFEVDKRANKTDIKIMRETLLRMTVKNNVIQFTAK